jgi:hypothetical protein
MKSRRVLEPERPGQLAHSETKRESVRKRGLDGGEALVAEAGADCNTLAANGAAAAQHGCAGLGLHARPEAVCLHTVAAVGLKCALGHGNALLFPLKNLRFDSIFEYIATCARNPARGSRSLRGQRWSVQLHRTHEFAARRIRNEVFAYATNCIEPNDGTR